MVRCSIVYHDIVILQHVTVLLGMLWKYVLAGTASIWNGITPYGMVYHGMCRVNTMSKRDILSTTITTARIFIKTQTHIISHYTL